LTAPVKHKVSRHPEMAVCGARRVEGAQYAWTFRQVTCPKCRETVLEARKAAKARLAEVTR